MSVQFIKGPSGSGKTTELYKQIVERSMEYPDKTFLLIVPEQNNLTALKELISKMPGKGIINVDVLGFNRLAHRIFDEAGGNNRQILDDTAKSLILRHIAENTDNKLRVLSKNIKKPGYIQEVKSVISEFMQYDVTISKLQNMIGKNQENLVLANKLSDILVLYEAFKDYLKDKYITTEEILDRAFELCPKADFLQSCELYLDGFTGFTPVQVRFIGQLMQQCERIVTTVTIGKDQDKDLFSIGFGMVKALTEEAKNSGTSIEADVVFDKSYRLENQAMLSFLEKNIFRFNGKTYRSEEDALVKVMEFQSVADEVYHLALDIKRRISKGDIRYREIAVLTGNVPAYADVVKKEFAKQDIPVFIDENINILLNPFCEMIESSIRCVLSDYSYEGVMRYLRSGLTDFSKNEVDLFDNYIKASGVKRLYQYKKEWTYIPRYMGKKSEKSQFVAEDLLALNKNRVRLIDSLAIIENKTKSAKEHCKDLYEFILVNNVYEKLMGFKHSFEDAGDFVHSKEYDQIYDKVMELLDKIVDFVGDEQMPLAEFLDELISGLSAISVGIIPPGIDRVMVADMTRSRINNIKKLYIIGCNDGFIPKDQRKGGILSESEREQLLLQNVELSPTSSQLISQDRFYLYMNLTKAAEAIDIYYPLMGNDGTALKVSSLINEIKKIYPDLIIYNGDKKPIKIKGFAVPDDFYDDATRKISRDIATALYGKVLSSSVTRLELFSGCPYAHFLKYGLLLKESEEYGFGINDLGTIYHDVLQKYSEKLRDSSYNWFDISMDESNKLLDEAITIIADNNKDSALFESKRSEYMLKRIRRIVSKAIEVINIQIRQGRFEPYGYEVSFGPGHGVEASDFTLSEDEIIKLRGRIDRVDTYKDENNVYVKIVDYKSGDKSFSLANVYHGLSLQLVVYLNAAMEIMGKRDRDKEVVPAALLYYRINDPLVERPADFSKEAVSELVLKELRTKGLVNSDGKIIDSLDKDFEKKSLVIPVGYTKDGGFDKFSSVANDEEFELISNYVNQYIKNTANQILDGEISVSPYKSKHKSGCDYCKYKGICNVDLKKAPYRDLEEYNKDEAIERMKGSMQ